MPAYLLLSVAALAAFRVPAKSPMAPDPTEAVALAARPNIVLILTDDQRWDTLWAMPIVRSRLASEGITFSNALVVNPLCCPSRASILTGKYSHSTGVYDNRRPHGALGSFRPGATIATSLHSAGYRTALIGKYMNGYGDRKAYKVPLGWDRWVAFTSDGGQGRYYNYRLSIDGVSTAYGSTPEEYSTDVLAGEAASFIKDTASTKPLFLYFAPKAPHEPYIPAPRHRTAFADLASARPASYNEPDVSDKPAYIQEKLLLTPTEEETRDIERRRYYRTLLAVDEAVDQILDALAVTGRLSNSMVVFMSDNGFLWGEHRVVDKRVPYEESIRVPMVVRYDPLISAARTDDHLVLNIDVAPTFGQLAGVSIPGAEGRSFRDLLTTPTTTWRRDFLIEHYGGGAPTYCAVRNSRYTYVAYGTGEEELYDLSADPYQLSNKARDASYATQLGTMRTRVRQLCYPTPPDFSFSY